MLSLMAALAALLCLLLTVAGLFKPALLGQKRRLNAFFIGLYGFLCFSLLGMVPDGKIELSGGLVLLALLAAAHSILLFISHALAVLKMSKEERAKVRPGKAAAGVVLLFFAAGSSAWMSRPVADSSVDKLLTDTLMDIVHQPLFSMDKGRLSRNLSSTEAAETTNFIEGETVYLKDKGFKFRFYANRELIPGQPITALTFSDELHVLVKSGGMLQFCDWDIIPQLQARNYASFASKLLSRTVPITYDVYGDSLVFGQANARDLGATDKIDSPTGFGDGSVHGHWKFNEPWPSYLQASLQEYLPQKVIVRNAGYSGDRVFNGYLRHRIQTQADLSIIAYGTNDTLYATDNGRNPDGIFTHGLYNVTNFSKLSYLFSAREILRGKAVVLMGTPIFANIIQKPILPWDNTQFAATRLSHAYDTASADLARILGADYIDTKRDIIRQHSVLELTNDGVHYNSTGAKLVGNRISAMLRIPYRTASHVNSGSVLIANPAMSDVGGHALYGAKYDSSSSAPKWGLADKDSSTITTEKNSPLSFNFYSEDDGLVVFVNSRSKGKYVEYDMYLDGGAVQPLLMFSQDEKRKSPESYKKIKTSIDKNRNNSDVCSPSDPVILIASRGWHTLTIKQTGKNPLSVDSISFVSIDNLSQPRVTKSDVKNCVTKTRAVGMR
ncbi:SGNH/GDSL hydrolase family protein [Aeromonas jandaei]|uniref:SGNH/GDSL hydrolase family protein n=1 Tax=Aeromonas jandaei TaxID=650 RepID=UPI0012ECB1B2|nr:SGNH/GDSL hydrolase family protein [Aeromonas jandaei]MVG15838.1 SGNH/GDSL hydrolase family protein [Aeromonas jandaei]